MSIFIDDVDPAQSVDERRPTNRAWLAVGVVFGLLIVLIILSMAPSPFVIEKPGPVYDTLGSTTVEGEQVPMIEIPAEQTFETSGTLDMLTVTVSGNRERPASWFEAVTGALNPSYDVVPIEEIYPEGTSIEQSNEQSQIDMQNSQREAVAAALTELGYTFTSTLRIEDVVAGGPADGLLVAGDIVVSVNGGTFDDVSQLRAIIAENGTDAAATVVVRRGGEELSVDVTPEPSAGAQPVPIVGITLSSAYDFPVDVEIQLENVGGPSAGQMFALGIVDKLTEGELTGGYNWAGTGTITGDGAIGAIGGIKQKMHGARAAGAEYFLAPSANCDQVTGEIPSGLTVFAVTTLDDSIAALEAVSAGGDTSALPTCTSP